MKHAELAARLVEANNAERRVLLKENHALADSHLAYLIKDICLNGWSSYPANALGAAAALQLLSELKEDQEIAALNAWTSGLEGLIDGQMEQAIEALDNAEGRFLALEKHHSAAATQVSKLIALAMLGRYDEAIECGLRIREVFLVLGHPLSAGKVEHNLGNIYFRRDQYREAEDFQRAARSRFITAGDQIQIAKIENSLALTLSAQHKIQSAEELYAQALARAEDLGLLATQAEIESSLGVLALYQGRYDRSLDYLERSRRKYVELKMPHLSAMVEHEIAEAYLELNLTPEAAEIYERVTKIFVQLGLQAEAARALLSNSRAAIRSGQTEKARSHLAEARELYLAASNSVGVAMVQFTEAQLLYGERRFSEARAAAAAAQLALAAAGSPRPSLVARWLVAESARADARLSEAELLLKAALDEAEVQKQPDIASRCNTSLGLLAETLGDDKAGEKYFKRSIAIIEELREPLAAEEFRTAFFADKLVPYHAMVRLCLQDEQDRVVEALGFVEQARARALADVVGGSVKISAAPRDQFENDAFAKLEKLRHQLNYFDRQLKGSLRRDSARGELELTELRRAVREREKQSLEITRQLQHRGERSLAQIEALDFATLQQDLGSETALVEYTSIDDELLAFVVTDQSVVLVRNLGSETAATAELGQLRFQIDALRHGSPMMRKHLPDLTRRVRRHLELLYDQLLRPIEERIGERRLVIVPHRALNYLPFQALHDGATYLIERREVSYAPSALVLQQCLARSPPTFKRMLLLGVADEQTPRVRDEIEALRSLFPETDALLDHNATIEALRRHAPAADVIHLACHGRFRPDNPLFSALQLGNGWLTVRDAYSLRLDCSLVTLSACETGMNDVVPGDELIGLARGFFAAGSPSLLISLWTVDDEATAHLMTEFYQHLRENRSPAAALRHAQLRIMGMKPHPFFWSPFVLVGRW